MVQRPTSSTNATHHSFRDTPTYQALKTFKKPSQFLTGYTALAARNLPFTATQFPVYEHLKSTIYSYRRRKGTATATLAETAAVTAISAGCAGTLAALITAPVDVVKTRMMLSATRASSDAEDRETARTRKGGLAVAREILAESGVRGLFRGAALRCAWTALGSGLYLGVYESGRVWLGERRK